MANLSFSSQWMHPTILRTIVATVLLACTTYAQNSTIVDPPVNNGTDTCSCGFQDPNTNNIFTDSLIVYFNETNTSVPNNLFSVDTFEHRYEKGWSIFYREGASPSNVLFTRGNV